MADNLNLPLEYQGMYRSADGDLRFANGVYDADSLRPGRILGLGFFEKIEDIPFIQRGVCPDHGTDAPLVGFKGI